MSAWRDVSDDDVDVYRIAYELGGPDGWINPLADVMAVHWMVPVERAVTVAPLWNKQTAYGTRTALPPKNHEPAS